MKKSSPLAIAVFVSIVALLLVAPSAAQAQHKGNRLSSKGSSSGKDTYLVVKVTDPNKPDRKVDYKVITTSQFRDEEKRLKEDYDKLIEEWKDVKKTDHAAPMPVKGTIKKIGTPYHSQKIAQQDATKLADEEAEKDNPTSATAAK